MVSLEQLKAIVPNTSSGRLALFVEPVNHAVEEFGTKRLAEWLANVAHESGGFVYTAELWGPTQAQAGYDLRKDLGNTRPEAIEVAKRHGSTPGPFFRGHGLIQTTGYDNHCEARDKLGIDCVENPKLLTEPVNAARSAAMFWRDHGCDDLPDFEAMVRRVNGGLNGLADRYSYLGRARAALA